MRRLTIWLVCILGAAFTTSAQARDLLAVGTNFPRVFMADASGQLSGLAVDLLRRAALSQGLKIRFETYPWARAQAMVEQGQADILIGPYRTPERERRFLYSQLAFYEDALVFYAKRSTAELWRGDVAALRGRSIGLVLGWSYGTALEQARPSFSVSSPGDVATGLRMLQRGRIELLASNERNTLPVLETLGLSQELVALQPPITVLGGHFAFTRNAAGENLKRGFDQALEQQRASGALLESARLWKVRSPE